MSELKQHGNEVRALLREPAAGLMAGLVVVGLLTGLRHLLYALGGAGVDFGFLLYLAGSLVVFCLWGRSAALVTVVVSLAFVLGDKGGMTPLQRLYGTPLFLGAAALFGFLVDREKRMRAQAEERMAALVRERDRLIYLQQQAEAEQRRAREIAREQERVLATLQKETLTAADPKVHGLTFALKYAPASADALVGGDFYNVFRLSDSRAAVILGDVTGKGAQAAASGVVVSNMLRAFFAESHSPANVIQRLNAALASDPDFAPLVTLFAAVVDGAESTVVYANAGQEHPCLISPWGKVTLLETTGMTIGTMPDAAYEEVRLDVPPGQTLVAFTDGLTEIRLPDGSWMDPRRTYARLAEIGGSPPAVIAHEIITWAKEVSGGTLRDDAALLAIAFEGKSAADPDRPILRLSTHGG